MLSLFIVTTVEAIFVQNIISQKAIIARLNPRTTPFHVRPLEVESHKRTERKQSISDKLSFHKSAFKTKHGRKLLGFCHW